MEIYYFDPYFWKVITCLKTKNTFLMCKQHLHNCHMIAMGTMTCQDYYTKQVPSDDIVDITS